MSGGLFSARTPDPRIIVGELDRYRCATVEDCDHALRILVPRIGLIVDGTLLRKHLHDRDLLIDRRCELMAQATA